MSLPNYIYPLKSESDLLNNPKSFGIIVMNWKDYNKINMGSSLYCIIFHEDGNSVESKSDAFKDYLKSQNIIILKWTIEM